MKDALFATSIPFWHRNHVLAVAALAALTIHAAVLFGFNLSGLRSLPTASEYGQGIEVTLSLGGGALVAAAAREDTSLPEIVPPVLPEEAEVVEAQVEPVPTVKTPTQRRRNKVAPVTRSSSEATGKSQPLGGGDPSPSEGIGQEEFLGGGDTSEPVPLGQAFNPSPVYPELARRRGQEGTVRLLVQVGTDGVVHNLGILHSSGYTLLDEAAVRAVRRWRFKPAFGRGGIVAGEVIVPVEFRLR